MTAFASLPNVAETWLRGLFWKTVKWIALCVKCGQCLCWRLIILLSQWHCQFGKVHADEWQCSIRYTNDRQWQQCRNQNRLALLLMTSDITQYRTWYSVRGCSANLVRLKLQWCYLPLFQHIPPWRQKNREARSTALQPIRPITGHVVAGRHCSNREQPKLIVTDKERVSRGRWEEQTLRALHAAKFFVGLLQRIPL